jgi:hypothetical protein
MSKQGDLTLIWPKMYRKYYRNNLQVIRYQLITTSRIMLASTNSHQILATNSSQKFQKLIDTLKNNQDDFYKHTSVIYHPNFNSGQTNTLIHFKI